eukprot:gene8458-9363_t
MALAKAGIDTSVYKAHSTRAAASSAAKANEVSIRTIMDHAGWSSENTFMKFYNKKIVADNNRTENFGQILLKICGFVGDLEIHQVYEFDMDLMSWVKIPKTVEFCEEKSAAGAGGFRTASKASSKHPDFVHNSWVIKHYLPDALKYIEDTGQTAEENNKKMEQEVKKCEIEDICAPNSGEKSPLPQLKHLTDLQLLQVRRHSLGSLE